MKKNLSIIKLMIKIFINKFSILVFGRLLFKLNSSAVLSNDY